LIKHGERFYRDFAPSDRWTAFRVKVETTDLYIRAQSDRSARTRDIVERMRGELRGLIDRQGEFLTSLDPVPRLEDVPEVAARMYKASELAGVGPMAAVAGAIAELTGKELTRDGGEIVIENGGDIWLFLERPLVMGLFAGHSPFTGTLGIRIVPGSTPLGICTSSGKVGHSMSFGRADAVTVLARDAALADAVATGACNRVKTDADLGAALEYAMAIPGVSGVMAVIGDRLAVQGDVELVETGGEPRELG